MIREKVQALFTKRLLVSRAALASLANSTQERELKPSRGSRLSGRDVGRTVTSLLKAPRN